MEMDKRFMDMEQLENITDRGIVPGFFRRGFIRSVAWVLLGGALSLTGCSKDPLPVLGESPDGKQGLTLALVPQFAVEVDVKSSDPGYYNNIYNLWIIQLNETGTARLSDPIYLLNEELETIGFTNNGSGRILVEELKPVPSRIYAIANTNDGHLYSNVTSETDILSVQGTGFTQRNFPKTGFPMSGSVQLTSATNEVTIPLYRAVAKVNFSWTCTLPSGESFVPARLHLRQVPSTLNYFRDYENLPDPATDPYPAVGSDPVMVDWVDLNITDKDPYTENTYSWYLPENARGTGTAAVPAEKCFLTAPRGQENYCTEVIICGTYGTTVFNKKVSYHFYLGGDNTKDYNLLRNREYNISVTITGVNDADMRVMCEKEETPAWNYAEWSSYTHGHNSKCFYTGRFRIAINDYGGSARTYTWDNALTACSTGWRLPTLTELELIYCMRNTWADLNADNFYTTGYWSATEDTSNSDNAWAVNFSNCAISSVSKSTACKVRCVRDDL